MNTLLSASFLYPFSRVTYCAYLVHPIMIRIVAMRLDSPMHLSLEIMVCTQLFILPKQNLIIFIFIPCKKIRYVFRILSLKTKDTSASSWLFDLELDYL